MELIKILKYLDKKFPTSTAADWDKVGLQILNPKQEINNNQEIQKILTCLDVNLEVVNQAIAQNVNLIISRHPFIFGELSDEKNNHAKKMMMKKLISHNIYIYAIHTNFDSSNNNPLLKAIEQHFHLKKISPFGKTKDGWQIKLRSPITLAELRKKMQQLFAENDNLVNVNWNDHTQVQTFYLVPGSGSEFMVLNQLTDVVFITGEVKWHHWIYANDNQVNLLSLGHYMENHFTKDLENILTNAFKEEVTVFGFDIQKQYKK
ncbi:Nif3-like dinuclear metal center hexameric protein [Williamsoniiplasma lucivorax]|uniref:GTP cyclohydrolase 1 type 2 homolog n=1 Tax=Williamsoniiplasma lucivorax TaxID=209274 RepID=A0A2S5RCZ8_9MOLU|nr:Nif3-like dinuclear metal center hexameric protein [Williamsoniiplasma lucivorax]PPE05194.1 Nif3-like dinuclear metal center hexameric protein [Williamsoniiplasma lucivorax]